MTSSGGADVTARGVCWSDGHTPTVDDSKTIDGMGSGSFASNLTGLTANTTYYVRAYATNSVGTAYGNMITFAAMEILPATVTTSAIASILSTYAVTGGNITSNGGAKVMEWGVCWSTSVNPTTSSVVYNITGSEGGSGVFTATLTGLTVGTTYFIRAYATNSAGTAYGDQLSFTTLNKDEISPVIFYPGSTYGSVSDIDGNLYKTIQIGSQIWMAENLKTTKFNDGADIPLVESNSEWSGLFVPGYCYYNIDPGSYKQIYGALYNWYAVNTGKLCPDGWRVPSSEDIEILNDNYGYTAMR